MVLSNFRFKILQKSTNRCRNVYQKTLKDWTLMMNFMNILPTPISQKSYVFLTKDSIKNFCTNLTVQRASYVVSYTRTRISKKRPKFRKHFQKYCYKQRDVHSLFCQLNYWTHFWILLWIRRYCLFIKTDFSYFW